MGDAEADDVLGRHAVDTLAVEDDFALGTDHAADRAQGGGLAGAVGAQQRGHAALADREIDAVEDFGFAIGGVEALGLEQVAHARGPRTLL